jgi:hypothetical protein
MHFLDYTLFGLLMLQALILYVMRRRVRLGRRKGTF